MKTFQKLPLTVDIALVPQNRLGRRQNRIACRSDLTSFSFVNNNTAYLLFLKVRSVPICEA